MGMESPSDIDRAAIEEHTQHLVEQAALRKMRKTLDGIEEAETDKRRALRKVLLICAILAVFAAGVLAWLVFRAGDLPQQPPTKIPDKLQRKP